jgi:alkanesulfonate monooxygenase
MNSDRKMRLAAYYNPTGHHVASWRHPRADADAHVNIQHYIKIAQTAEKAKFDLIFLADGVATRQADIEAQSRSVQFIANFEPMTLLSALAMVTEKIGLICTMSTSYNEPYNVARRFASLDLISGGRGGWNLVTSGQTAEALNFGRTGPMPHGERYQRAHEFAKIVKGLWDSWDDDAFVRDKETGLFFDPSKMHYLNHVGQNYQVRGPLNVPRSPQGHPVMVQAGASDEGRELAAAYAEAIFSPHLNVEAAKAYYDDTKGSMTKYGRDPDHLKITQRFPASARDASAVTRSPTSCSIAPRKAVSAGSQSDGTVPRGRLTVRATKPGGFWVKLPKAPTLPATSRRYARRTPFPNSATCTLRMPKPGA